MADTSVPAPTVGRGPGRLRRLLLRAEQARRAVAAESLLWAALALVVAAGLLLRLNNVDWDDGHHLHPDERFLTMVAGQVRWPSGPAEYFDSARSPLNPYNHGNPSFVYGTLPLFLTVAAGDLLGRTDYGTVYLVGRVLSALFDAGTIVLLFLTGLALYGRRTALLAAALGAFTVLHIQLAHFFAVDTFLTFFTTLALYAAVRIARGGGTGAHVLAGAALGLAMACKASALPLAGVITVAAAAGAWPALPGNGMPWTRAKPLLARAALRLALAGAVSLLVFRVLNPYVFAGPHPWNLSLDDRFQRDLESFRTLASGEVDFPPSLQWVDRTAYLFPLENMVRWGMGPALGVAAVGGAAFAAWELVRRRRLAHLVPLTWAAGYFAWVGDDFATTLRYFLPIYPALTLLAAGGLVRLVDAAAGLPARPAALRPAARTAAVAAGAAVLAGTVLWALAFSSIYGRPVTRVEASQWIYRHVPPGSAVTNELWDDGLPLPMPEGSPAAYRSVQMTPFDPDTPEKRSRLLAQLNEADYIVLSSNRAYGTIMRLPLRYPLTSRYYELLFSGELGFEKVAEFTSYPSLLGVTIPDDAAEEAFTVYDHPKVLIFRKTPAFSPERAAGLLPASLLDGAVAAAPADLDKHALLLTPAERAQQEAGGTWSALFDAGSLANRYPVLAWLLMAQAAGLAAAPLLFWLLRPLPDRGYALSKPVGLLLLAYVVWLGVSLDLFTFSRTAVLLALAALLAAGAAAALLQRRALAAHLRRGWRDVAAVEALFLAAFLAFTLVRAANPDLWHPYRGGEKPMDLAYLTAVVRSTTLPPYDPWFAGGALNYYYFGQFILAVLVKGTGILPEVAFNLAIPLLFALTAVGAYGVVANLVRAGGGSWRAGAAAGLLAFLFLAVLGNLNAVDQTYDALMQISPWSGASWVPFWGHAVQLAGGVLEAARGTDLPPLDYWRPSRMLPPSFAITEFPFFSFLFADLHAHLIGLPFTIAFAGLAAALALGARREGPGGLRGWLAVALLGLTAGALRWINSWDYPGALLLGLAALGIAHLTAARTLRPGLVFPLVAQAGAFAGLSLVLFLPLSDRYQQFYDGVIRSPETTPVHQYLSHFGLFAFVLASLLAGLLLTRLRRVAVVRHVRLLRHRRRAAVWRRYRRWVREPGTGLLLAPSLAVAALALLLLAWGNGYGLAALLAVPLATAAVLLLHEAAGPRDPATLLVLTMVVLGLGMSIGVDLVTVEGDIGRMNTVFKFYLQVWTLFALASAYGVWWLARRLRPGSGGRPAPGAAWLGVLGLLVVGSALYPLRAVPARVEERFVALPEGLDGAAYMADAVYQDEHGPLTLRHDYEAIQWLREHVEGTP
ncbi:MAG TPA: DUF2298 domain-containing protein, partial [Dehalococcoidia bacterium]